MYKALVLGGKKNEGKLSRLYIGQYKLEEEKEEKKDGDYPDFHYTKGGFPLLELKDGFYSFVQVGSIDKFTREQKKDLLKKLKDITEKQIEKQFSIKEDDDEDKKEKKRKAVKELKQKMDNDKYINILNPLEAGWVAEFTAESKKVKYNNCTYVGTGGKIEDCIF